VKARSALIVLVLSALIAFGPVSIDMYLPALPAIARDLGGGASGAELSLSAFFFGFGAGQLLYGPLADRFGRRPPLFFGLALFIAASAGCALAPGMGALIAFRFLEALGGAAGPVLARAIVRDLYDRDRGARILSLMVLIMGVAPLLAPVIGGQVLVLAGWRAIFWILAAFGALCMAATFSVLPETLAPEKRLGESLFALVRFYLDLMRDRRYLAYALSGAAMSGGLFAYLTGSPFVFITLYGVPPEHFGFVFGLNALGIMAAAAINGRLVVRLGADRLLAFGTSLGALSGIVLALVAAAGFDGFPGLLTPLFLFVSSIGFVGANSMAGALALYPSRAGIASALSGTLQFLIGGLGGALVGLLADGTALPMAGVIAAAGLLSFGLRRILAP
jgi:DHA1 family bicyclomycin/chloramphenicol resistance-like MFS transporter